MFDQGHFGDKISHFNQRGMRIAAGNDILPAIPEYWGEPAYHQRDSFFAGGQDVTGLGRRVSSVEAAFLELLQKKLGRVAKLASGVRPRVGPALGLRAMCPHRPVAAEMWPSA